MLQQRRRNTDLTINGERPFKLDIYGRRVNNATIQYEFLVACPVDLNNACNPLVKQCHDHAAMHQSGMTCQPWTESKKRVCLRYATAWIRKMLFVFDDEEAEGVAHAVRSLQQVADELVMPGAFWVGALTDKWDKFAVTWDIFLEDILPFGYRIEVVQR